MTTFAEARAAIELVANEMRGNPDTPSLKIMWDWCMRVSGWLSYIGVEEIKAECVYKRLKAQMRPGLPSAADTNTAAEGTPPYKEWREWKKLHDDAVEVLKTIKRFVVAAQEERGRAPQQDG